MIDAFYNTYDIKLFAPSHTSVIRKDVPQYLVALREVMRRVVINNYDIVY